MLERPDGSRRLEVRITLETHDGELIYATYGGLFCRSAAVTERLARGETVESDQYYFRTAPLFETASQKYDWLNRLVALGIGRRSSGRVAYNVYAIA